MCVFAVLLCDLLQWFYGPTWGRTLKFCERLSASQRHGGCASRAEVRARQLELVEVLRRNVMHQAVAEVHVLLGEAEPVREFLRLLPWYENFGCKLHLHGTGTRPSFRTYMQQLSGPLRGRAVAVLNQDVVIGAGEWAAVPELLPPRSAFFLSRYHTRFAYDVQHSLAAAAAVGLFNATGSSAAAQRRKASLLEGAAIGSARGKRVCDMTAGRFSLWRRSLCSPANFGSYDAYVLRIERELTPAELDLFDYPQNAWGGENLFLFLVQKALGMECSNPCLSLQALHVHCEMPTEFGVLKVGDRRLGKKEIVERALAKLRVLGRTTATSAKDVGTLTLNVTRLAEQRQTAPGGGVSGHARADRRRARPWGRSRQ